MFGRYLFAVSTIVISFSSLVVYPLFYVKDSDRLAYKALMNLSEEPLEEDSKDRKTEQQRISVHKQILLNKEGKRVETHLASDFSDLTLKHQGPEERLSGLKGYSQENLKIAAAHAIFNDKFLSLSGEVLLQNEMGQISAREAICHLDESKKIAQINFRDDIRIHFDDNQSCKCENAQVDAAESTVFLTGNGTHPDVSYEKNSLGVLSHEMRLAFKEGKVFDSLEAKNNVRINYADKYTSQSQKATYNSDRIILSSYDSDSFCELSDKEGSQVHACEVQIDVEKKQMHFQGPKGTLKDEIEFSANKLTWDDNAQTLLLEDNVHIKQKGLGEIVTPYEVKVVFHEVEGKKEVQVIEVPRDSVLTFADEIKGLVNQLSCKGALRIDHENKEVVMNGLEGSGENSQVHFSNLMGDLYADRATLSYENDDKKKGRLTFLHMDGHAKCLNRFDGHLQESGLVLQYVLADHIDYFADKHEIWLKGQANNRVLMFDRVKNMQMSAPSLKIFNLENRKKPTIQGIGDVRMKFAEQELQQMKQYFHFEDSL